MPGHRAAFGVTWLYNPREIAIGGSPGLYRTAVVDRVVSSLSRRYAVGCVRRDPSGPPAPGGRVDPAVERLTFLEMDFVIVEGAVAGMPLVLVVDDASAAAAGSGERCGDDESAGEIVAVVAGRNGSLPAGVPRLDGERGDDVADFVLEHLRQRAVATPLNGLVLAGGESRRMGRDKAALAYHGRPQTEHLVELLGRVCAQVYVSSRREQSETDGRRGLPQIHDRFIGFGPAGGILSALHYDTGAAWLVVACDLPFADEASLALLVEQRDPFRSATCYRGSDGLPEPMCAIYEPKFRFRLHNAFAAGALSPRGALSGSRIRMVEPRDPAALANVNEPGEYSRVVAPGGAHGRG